MLRLPAIYLRESPRSRILLSVVYHCSTHWYYLTDIQILQILQDQVSDGRDKFSHIDLICCVARNSSGPPTHACNEVSDSLSCNVTEVKRTSLRQVMTRQQTPTHVIKLYFFGYVFLVV